VTSCTFNSSDVDAVTGASRNHAREVGQVPPDAASYEVIGVVDGLKGFVAQYDERFYRGDEPFPDPAGKFLKSRNIRTIISIMPSEHERGFCGKHGFALVEIPFEKTDGLSPDGLKTYQQALKEGAGPFYVHCHGGTHRGGVLGAAYRVHAGLGFRKGIGGHGRLGGDLLGDHVMLESIRQNRCLVDCS
jgi:hypothetical protein